MTRKEKMKYQVRDEQCYTKKCFTPFSGNGWKICRLYEMGQCPDAVPDAPLNRTEKKK